MKKAFITGVTGQDGSYLAELLLEKGYEVFGMVRRASTFNRGRIEHLRCDENFKLVYGDLGDSSILGHLVDKIKPDEVYNLAAQSHVAISFDIPEYTGDVTGIGTLRLLEAIRRFEERYDRKIKFYQASSSELYGKVREVPQTEKTPFYPRSPYACAKLYAYAITVNYRESYGLFACNGILFNHESPRRGENFVTKKITREIAKIVRGKSECLFLGNLDAKRDWGHAKDYVYGMWKILQQSVPEDFVIATGETHSVREFLVEAFNVAGISIESNGKIGVDEVYIRKDNGKVVVRINPKYFRPSEVDLLIGNPAKMKEKLGWEPKIHFKELVREMVMYDMRKY